jgi:nickel/cobalt transporter (NicO) family protein
MIRALALAFALMTAALGIVASLPAMAQTTDDGAATQGATLPKIDRRKLIVPPRNPDGSLITTPFLDDPLQWAREKQREFYGSMSASMRSLKSSNPLAAALTLILLSFGYGIFHAAGPGHGKAVISTWLVATENQLHRGVIIAFMSAAVQAASAIAIVSILLLVITSVTSAARNVADVLESVSYALVALMGLWLIASALRGVSSPKIAPVPARPVGDRHSHHHHEHCHHHEAHEGSDHVHDAHCGHNHFPAARELSGEWSLSKASSLAFAVGLRPCTGSIAALILANAIGLYWAGVVSTLIMALGTAITVSAIAAIAVYSKHLAMRFASTDTWLQPLTVGLKLAGGSAIALFGGLLFWSSLWTTQPLM